MKRGAIEFRGGQGRLHGLAPNCFRKGDEHDRAEIATRRHFMREEWPIRVSAMRRSKIICAVRAFLSVQINRGEGTSWRVSVKEAESMKFRNKEVVQIWPEKHRDSFRIQENKHQTYSRKSRKPYMLKQISIWRNMSRVVQPRRRGEMGQVRLVT